MKKRLITLVFGAFLMMVGVGAMTQLSATPTSAAGPNPTCAKRFLTFPVWYRGLTVSDTDCNIISPSDPKFAGGKDAGIGTFIGIIALNVVEMILQLIGYLAAFFIIYGGFIYMTQSSEPSKIEQARKTIFNAVIGLVVSIFSIAIVNLIFGYLT